MTDDDRVSIWSVSRADLRWFSVLFPSLWIMGTLYYAAFRASWNNPADATFSTLFNADIGLSAAVLALMVIAGKAVIVVLFDWPIRVREKRREEGRREARQEIRAKISDWDARRREAERRGEKFDEPPPLMNPGDSD